jgi:hypothetical protein
MRRVFLLLELIINHVDWSGRRETPAGGRDRGDPAVALATRRLPEPPAESEAPGAPISRQIAWAY